MIKIIFFFSSAFVAAVEEKKKNLKHARECEEIFFSHSTENEKSFFVQMKLDITRETMKLFEAHQLRMKEEEKIV